MYLRVVESVVSGVCLGMIAYCLWVHCQDHESSRWVITWREEREILRSRHTIEMTVKSENEFQKGMRSNAGLRAIAGYPSASVQGSYAICDRGVAWPDHASPRPPVDPKTGSSAGRGRSRQKRKLAFPYNLPFSSDPLLDRFEVLLLSRTA